MVSCSAGDAVAGHAGAQAAFEVPHALHGAAHADGAAQFFGFGAGEVGDDHGHAEQLFLKERHTEGSLEHWLEQRMRVGDFFLALAAAHVGMHHFADDGAGANDGDLDDDVVEAAWGVVGEGGHLGAAFDLEHADGVGLAESFVDEGIFGEGGEIDWVAVVLRDEFEGIFEDGHHAEAEEVDFDDAEVGAVFLVPLHDGAAGHGGALDRDDAIEHAGADDHAAGVLAEMAGKVCMREQSSRYLAMRGMAHVEAGIDRSAWPWCRSRRATPSGRRGWRACASCCSSKPSALPTSRAAERPR